MRRYAVVIDLGGTNIKMAVLKLPVEIIANMVLPTRTFKSKDKAIRTLVSAISDMLSQTGIVKKDVLGIGIGAPGLIDSKKGIIHYLVNIKGWKEVPLKAILQREVGLSTYLDNDVNVMTLGEYYHGAGIGAKNIVCLTLGTGVGGGLIIDGRLYRGSSMSAGEIGHIPISENGPFCNCGGLGCLERYVGNAAIVEYIKDEIKSGNKTLVLSLCNGNLNKITPRMITEAARQGDRTAILIWQKVGTYLGIALSGVINLLNPEKIIIGGGVAEAGKYLFVPIRQTIRQRAMRIPGACVKVVRARLRQTAGLIGAGVLVRINKGLL